jgi:hypothetical protein
MEDVAQVNSREIIIPSTEVDGENSKTSRFRILINELMDELSIKNRTVLGGFLIIIIVVPGIIYNQTEIALVILAGLTLAESFVFSDNQESGE